jgi:hypothetical protein
MAQYVTQKRVEATTAAIANPVPLGMSALAFATALIGCIYSGFILPATNPSSSLIATQLFFYGGIAQVLAGMWAFRRDETLAATLFTAYGAFLAALAFTFAPGLGIPTVLVRPLILYSLLGLFYLAWAIFTGVLFIASLKTNAALLAVLGLLFCSFLALAIGELVGGNIAAFVIGGWLGIFCALAAWYTALASLLSSATHGAINLPVGEMA